MVCDIHFIDDHRSRYKRLNALAVPTLHLHGDSGYALRPLMLTPILNAAVGSPEEHYTDLHCRVRNTVERCIGALKTRWRCLLAHRVLHYEPTKAAKIVNEQQSFTIFAALVGS
ncbi:unnamed protein product [Plutella xylostella]|uniref:(diamondback moth) hypothetical protein n=1 Tax=Plutella xylostella TaxID=51655 RepID=A0A8S4DVS9_PLUXY|nr:unnamed protein product [Plutella xylostella]